MCKKFRMFVPLFICLLLFFSVSCERLAEDAATETAPASADGIDSDTVVDNATVIETDIVPDMPVYTIGDIVSKVIIPIAVKYADLPSDVKLSYIEASDENKRVYSPPSAAPFGYRPTDENDEYDFSNWFQAGDNGVELMDNLCRWILPERQNIREQEEKGLLPYGRPNPLIEWVQRFVTYPEEVFDTTGYKEKVLEKVAKLYETKFPGEAPADLTLNPVVPRIQASFEYEDEHIDLDCRVLDFDVKRTETGYQKIYFLVDTSEEEEKVIWMFVDCFKVKKQ